MVKPKFHYANFHRNFPVGKVVDTNHESHGTSPQQIRLCWSNGIKSITVHGKSQWQSLRHKSWKSATWFVSRTFMICVCDKVGVMEFGLKQLTAN